MLPNSVRGTLKYYFLHQIEEGNEPKEGNLPKVTELNRRQNQGPRPEQSSSTLSLRLQIGRYTKDSLHLTTLEVSISTGAENANFSTGQRKSPRMSRSPLRTVVTESEGKCLPLSFLFTAMIFRCGSQLHLEWPIVKQPRRGESVNTGRPFPSDSDRGLELKRRQGGATVF